jgi:hypothetical protein
MARPTVFVCRGSSCRHDKGFHELCAQLEAVADVSEVRCQRICDGPVAGAAVNGSLEWFERLRSEKSQRAFVDLVTGTGHMRHTLEKRRIEKRSGRLR